MANTKRKTKDQKFIELAKAVSKKSTCFRAHHGAVIVKGDEVISKGFNNAPEGAKNCKEFGNCLRVKLKIPRGQQYELCRSVHAEQNAIINAAKTEKSIKGGKIYLYSVIINEKGEEEIIDALPCLLCKKMIMNSGMKEMVAQQKDGSLKKYKIKDWIDECKKTDIINSKDQYGKKAKK